MSDDETELRTDQGESDCDGGDACKAIEVQNLPLAGGPCPDPARLRTEQLRMELETVYAALGLGLTSSPQRVVKLAADLWDLLGKPEKASVLRSDAPTPLALFDLCRGVHRYSDGPHDPLWLLIARNAMAGRKIAATTTETKPSTATVESVTETIRRLARESLKVATIDPLAVSGQQVIPIPPATFTQGPGGEPTITLAVHKSPSVPLEVADINRAEGAAAGSADLFTRTLEHEAVASGAAGPEPEGKTPAPVVAAIEAVRLLGDSGRALGFWYTNHRGFRAWRWVVPRKFWMGGISHYPDVFHLFLDAFDLDRNADRSFLVERMEGPFQTAEPLDLPVGPTVDEQERLAKLRAEGHTDHCAGAQVAVGQECGCEPEVKWVPVTKKHADLVLEEWMNSLKPYVETPIEVGQVWITKGSEFPQWLDSQGQEAGTDRQRNDRWRRVVVKQGPNAGGLYCVVPLSEPDYLPSFVTAESLRESMRLRVGGLTGGPADTLLPADIIPEPAPVRVHVSPDGQEFSVDLSCVEFRESRPSEVLAHLPVDSEAEDAEEASGGECYRCEGEERFEGAICDGCGSVADGQGGTITPAGPYAEHLAIIESWRVADPPPTVPSGEVLSVEPEVVLNASVDGATRAFSVHPSALNTLNPSDPEGW